MCRPLSATARLLPLTAVLLGLGCGDNRLSGGGATFVDPIMQKWSAEFEVVSGGIEIDYSKSGSSDGIKQMTEKSLDFGCSDAPMKKDQVELARSKGGEVVHIPLVMGAVALVYNLPDVPELRLSGVLIADIYLGRLTRWDDPAIQSLNQGVPLPAVTITPVYRSEGSGTSNIFTEYLNKVSPDFADLIPAGTSPNWPKVGLGQKGNDGIAGHVKGNVGCIGYVEVSYAKMNLIPTALVQNARGRFVGPEAEAVSAAGEWALTRKQTRPPYSQHQLTYSLTDADAEAAYPICGISYGLLYQKQPARKGKALVEFFRWATSDGQKYALDLHYAPLPSELSKKIAARLDQIEFVD
jgi:phosphate transport system substrate-binding protein